MIHTRLYSGFRSASGYGASLLVLAGALLTAGCDSMVEPDRASLQGTTLAASDSRDLIAAMEPQLRVVSRAVAIAMQDREVRASVRDGLRDSPWSQHKVVLQDFLASAKGADLLAAAARAAGQTPAAFISGSLASLPPLDFYVPSRNVRRTWQGTPNVIVVGSLNPEVRHAVGFDRYGEELANPMDGVDNGTAVLLLHPAEPKLPRVQPHPRGTGEVIEVDGESTERLVWYDASGDSLLVDIEAVRAGRDARFQIVRSVPVQPLRGRRRPIGKVSKAGIGVVTPTPVNPSPMTHAYLDEFKLFFEDGWGQVELRIDARFYGPGGDYYGMARYSNDNVAHETTYTPGIALIAHIPPDGTPARINIDVWEDDCGCFGNSNDNYGNRDFVWFDRNETRTIHKGTRTTSLIQLNWFARATSQVASYTANELAVNAGGSTQATITAWDQYGYRLADQQHTISSWWTDNASVATVSPTGGPSGAVYGIASGQTRYNAQISGTSTVVSAGVAVAPCDPNDMFCAQ